MPTIQDKLNRGRKLLSVDDVQYDNDTALLDINALLKEIYFTLRRSWDEGKGNIVADQNEYRVIELDLESTDDHLEIIKVEKVFVDYGNGYMRAKRTSYSNIENMGYSETHPRYYEKDDSIFIFPTPPVEVTNGFKVEVKYVPNDVALDTEITDIAIPSNIIDVIFYDGLKYFVELEKKDENSALAFRQEYERKLTSAIGLSKNKVSDSLEIEVNGFGN